MYASEAKKRQPQTTLKSAIISKKSVNSLQKFSNSKPGKVKATISLTASKTKVIEHGVKNKNQNKSKFTIPSQALPSEKFAKRLNSTTLLPNKLSVSLGKGTLNMESNQKTNLTSISATKSVLRTRDVNNKSITSYKRSSYQNVHLNQNTIKERQKSFYELEKLPETIDISTQTNEDEILNHALIVGDLKIMQPSKLVIDEIEKMRKDLETKRLLKATRTFEEHSKKDEQHLEDLQEFLDKSYISRKPRRVRNVSLEEDHKLIASMDDLLQREKPQVESVTNIRTRIKQKEQELLNLFNHFQKTTEQFGKTET